MTYPLGLDLRNRKVLVVGGGDLATRRTRRLLEDGARVVVVAPEATDELRELAASGRLEREARGFESEDLDDAWLVLAHTDSPDLQDRIAAEAEARRIFCVKGGDPEGATARVPAVASAHGVDVAVNAGRDPRRAKAVAAWAAAGLETGTAPVRVQKAGAEDPDRQEPGTVALVGGGPGDPGLLSVRGRYLLAGADAIVSDRLGPTSLLSELAEHAEIVDVGKRAGYHKVSQDRINETLVEHARAGARVVRLKGGDPFVFGRGGEEAEFCRGHGIRVEVVPGITSAVSVPAAAGIPVTHRDLAHGFTVVTAHEQLRTVPHSDEHTIVLLMGVRRLATIAETLIDAGHRRDTPAAVVESGWTPRQRVTRGTLATIAEIAVARGVKAPAVTVVGRVAALAVADPVDPRRIPADDTPDQDPPQGGGVIGRRADESVDDAGLPVALKDAQRLGVVGDSIAYGRTDARGGWAGFVAAAHVARDEQRHRLFNLAWPGAFLSDVARTAPDELAVRRADTALISAGINDLGAVSAEVHRGERTLEAAADGVVATMRALCGELKRRGIRPIILSPTWVDEDRAREEFGMDLAPGLVGLYRERLRCWAAASSVDLLEPWPVLEDRTELLSDGVHPTAAGHRRLADWLLGAGLLGPGALPD